MVLWRLPADLILGGDPDPEADRLGFGHDLPLVALPPVHPGGILRGEEDGIQREVKAAVAVQP
jgi:hypothetical protein